MEDIRIKKTVTAFAVALFAGTISTAAIAQEGPGYNPDISRGEVSNFDQYLDSHPGTAKQLRANPALVNDPQFLSKHPGLNSFLASHPGVREEIHESPGQFMHRERGYERTEGRGYSPHPLANTDTYLDRHPEVAEQLRQHPGLVDDPAYLKNHPGLHEFLATHPVARHEWRSHPHRFMRHENQYDQTH
jgi:hypothetical protein